MYYSKISSAASNESLPEQPYTTFTVWFRPNEKKIQFKVLGNWTIQLINYLFSEIKKEQNDSSILFDDHMYAVTGVGNISHKLTTLLKIR